MSSTGQLRTSKKDTLRSPVFIVGPLRSGTTLLRLLLDHHGSISIFHELEGAVSQAVGDEWPALPAYYEFIENDRQMQDLAFAVDRSLSYEELVKSFLSQAYDRNPKPTIGAAVHSRMDLLPRLWPDARFIHLLRDPRDVSRSCIGMGWVGNVHEGVHMWIEAERRWDALRRLVDDANTIEVRFESLVREPEASLTRVCDWLQVHFDASMLDIENDTTYSRPDASYAEQWKTKLSQREIRWVEYQSAQMLQDRGYHLSGNPLQPPSLTELLYIRIQNRVHRVAHNVRRWGLGTWLGFVVAKRTGPRALRNHFTNRVNAANRKHLK